ncbi:3-hydroxyacyl-CoA dehydrogenase, conserved site-containing protein [Cynara cardunculus var. scolymus]|uniref:3-hydroxyacyl-CoA dehydrogenase, conserved site-containing protein n=1 Tax=Cynara cardunculus var. scolymus TaxID=59895 RepID=A0A103S8X0_CYNCS|nr:3-hydroxyacyl-CoA dehydrogenase, conserved site-containing protein [Cynara cardunculus var. scolymus]
MAEVIVTMEVGSDGVALITISNPPVNALAVPILGGLKDKFAEAMRRDDVKAIVLTGKNGRFSGGFDINVFQRVHQNGDISQLPDVSVALVTNTIEDAKKPIVAAVQGLALGGGLEIAMGCHARIAAPKAQLGLPELSLGTSKPILSEEGKKLGLIDAIVPPQELLKVSRQWALDIAEARKPWEVKAFNELVVSDTSKGLVHVFFAQRAISKVPNVTDIGLKPRTVKKVAVIGGGLMGSGIATALILGNISVVLKEINSEYLLKGIKTIEANVRGLVARKKLAQAQAEKVLSMVKGVLDYSEFRDVDMVIEIFSEIEKACPPHCILATNTSTIDLNLVGEKIKSQDRVVGAHFFSPAHVMPLLEIVRTEKTSAQVILDLMTVGKIIKKAPVVVGNCTGFAVNRTFFPYTQGAHILLHLGVDLFRIDRLISSFGLPMGPFQLQDLAGYGVALAVGKEFATAFPDRTFRSPIIDLLIKSGRNAKLFPLRKTTLSGKNNGKGYYLYEKGSKPKPDPQVFPIIEEAKRLVNLTPGGKPISITDQEIVEMILFPVVNEACRVLEEGVVVRASDLDVASVLGMSFPSYRGGIVFWGDLVGAKHIYTSLKKWSEQYSNFYKPSRFLEERAKNSVPLSAPLSSTSSRARL